MYNKILFGLIAVILVTGIARILITTQSTLVKVDCVADVGMCSDGTTVGRVPPSCNYSACPAGATLIDEALPPVEEAAVACTMDAMQCPNGSYVGRTGPNCEFVCPSQSADELQEYIAAKSNLINISNPNPYGFIGPNSSIEGTARGMWYGEGSFPVILVKDNDRTQIIATGVAKALGDWQTEDFVPFSATLSFDTIEWSQINGVYRGILILKKDNSSGLPEYDDSIEIPVTIQRF